MTIKYRSFDADNLTIENPVKVDNKRCCDIKYNGKDLHIQTPILQISKDKTSFVLAHKGELYTVFESIFDKIVDTFSDNSEIFNGRVFTKDDITSRLTPLSVLNPENGIVTINNIIIDPEVKIIDIFKKQLELDLTSSVNAIAILKISTVCITKRTMDVYMSITNIKVDPKKNIEICNDEDDKNLEDSESEDIVEDVVENVSEDIVEDVVENVSEDIVEDVVENTVEEVVDEPKDFFDDDL